MTCWKVRGKHVIPLDTAGDCPAEEAPSAKGTIPSETSGVEVSEKPKKWTGSVGTGMDFNGSEVTPVLEANLSREIGTKWSIEANGAGYFSKDSLGELSLVARRQFGNNFSAYAGVDGFVGAESEVFPNIGGNASMSFGRDKQWSVNGSAEMELHFKGGPQFVLGGSVCREVSFVPLKHKPEACLGVETRIPTASEEKIETTGYGRIGVPFELFK
jgi:hypothetical protein